MQDFARPKRPPNACKAHRVAGSGNAIQTTAWAKITKYPTDDAGRLAGHQPVEQFIAYVVGAQFIAPVWQLIARDAKQIDRAYWV
jgi:hypothetical protein